MRRLLALLALVVCALAFVPPAPAAAASADPNSGELRYEGIRTDTPEQGTVSTREVDVDLVCVDGVCIDEGFFVPFVDGVAEIDLPATGTGCDLENDIRARKGTLTAGDGRLTGEVDFLTRPLDCPDGTFRTNGTLMSFDLVLVSGDECLLDGSCALEPVVEDCCANPGAPRTFTTPTVFGGLGTVGEAATPGNLAWAAVGTVILALLIAIPTHLFNAAAETLGERLGAWWRRRRGRADAAPTRDLTGWPWAAGGVLAAAVMAALADPAFSFDAAGVRVLLSIVASFGVEVVLGWVAIILIVRRTHPAASATVRFAPLSLLLVAGAVLLTRMTGFEPPIVFGLVAGVVVGGVLATAELARVALIGLGWSFGVGLLAWIGYSLVPADAVVGRELLAAAVIAGLSTLPIALLPLRGLAGGTVWASSRLIWVVAYGIGLFAFLLVLLPLPASWAEVGVGLWAWVGLYLLYALAAVAAWLVVARPWRATTR